MFEKTKDNVEQAAGAAQETWGEATGNLGNQFKGAARKYAAKASDTSCCMAESIGDQIKANPLASAAIAGVAGIVLGILLGRR